MSDAVVSPVPPEELPPFDWEVWYCHVNADLADCLT